MKTGFLFNIVSKHDLIMVILNKIISFVTKKTSQNVKAPPITSYGMLGPYPIVHKRIQIVYPYGSFFAKKTLYFQTFPAPGRIDRSFLNLIQRVNYFELRDNKHLKINVKPCIVMIGNYYQDDFKVVPQKISNTQVFPSISQILPSPKFGLRNNQKGYSDRSCVKTKV